jgi:hypothetical protein
MHAGHKKTLQDNPVELGISPACQEPASKGMKMGYLLAFRKKYENFLWYITVLWIRIRDPEHFLLWIRQSHFSGPRISYPKLVFLLAVHKIVG